MRTHHLGWFSTFRQPTENTNQTGFFNPPALPVHEKMQTKSRPVTKGRENEPVELTISKTFMQIKGNWKPHWDKYNTIQVPSLTQAQARCLESGGSPNSRYQNGRKWPACDSVVSTVID